MRSFLLEAALALSILSMPSPADAAGGMIRASCTQNGRGVYREDIPADATADRRLAIAARHPEAMCVFLKIADLPPEYRDPSGKALLGSIPDEVLGGVGAPGQSADESLAAALSVLTGQGDVPSGAASGPAPTAFSNAWAQPLTSDPTEFTRQKPVNLTIGIYKDVPMDDVIAHWKAMQQGTKVLSRMTPNMTVTGNVTMLSVEDVQDHDAAELCQEAARTGSGCIAVY